MSSSQSYQTLLRKGAKACRKSVNFIHSYNFRKCAIITLHKNAFNRSGI